MRSVSVDVWWAATQLGYRYDLPTAHLTAKFTPDSTKTLATDEVPFTTTKAVFETEKSHLNYLVLDSGWEAKLGQVLDDMDEVIAGRGLSARR